MSSDKFGNSNNDAHVMAIVTRGGQTLGKDMINFDEDLNERRSDK